MNIRVVYQYLCQTNILFVNRSNSMCARYGDNVIFQISSLTSCGLDDLTLWGQVTRIWVGNLTNIAWSAPSNYLNQCWNIVNWTIRNKIRWNHNRNSYIFIQENAFEKIVYKMAVILSRPQWVKILAFSCHPFGNTTDQFRKPFGSNDSSSL